MEREALIMKTVISTQYAVASAKKPIINVTMLCYDSYYVNNT